MNKCIVKSESSSYYLAGQNVTVVISRKIKVTRWPLIHWYSSCVVCLVASMLCRQIITCFCQEARTSIGKEGWFWCTFSLLQQVYRRNIGWWDLSVWRRETWSYCLNGSLYFTHFILWLLHPCERFSDWKPWPFSPSTVFMSHVSLLLRHIKVIPRWLPPWRSIFPSCSTTVVYVIRVSKRRLCWKGGSTCRNHGFPHLTTASSGSTLHVCHLLGNSVRSPGWPSMK
jgi:hypothetical protein